ncbi:hypothetical protein B0H19DRAFT_1263207 [Mycena capillaripes]|nr:hypothetical protein B0H19DRAFT_1263207 [Mycena capillaripes]
MHRCMRIAEIVEMVCSYVEADWTGNHTLATLARTSSVFQDQALDLLWSSQYTLENILRCLPPDLVAFDNARRPQVVVRLLRPIVSSDWDRTRLYAHRVRDLYCDCDSGSLSLSQIFPALSISLPNDFLFPNLRKLTWYNSDEEDFHYINLCLARTLTHLSISPSSAFNLSILSTLPRKCPALKRLSIEGNISPSATACLPLVQLLNLESLRISGDDTATLEVIGRLQTLTKLKLHTLPRHLPSSLIHGSLFANVRQIVLLSVTPTAATEFFKTCTSASLTSAELEFNSYPSTSALNQFHASLGACRHSHLSLTSLTLSCFHVFEGNIASHAVDSATFRILFCFENITKVRIDAVSFDLDDAVLLEMARSWPQLEILGLALHAPPQPNQTHVTLHSLRSLAQHCPNLRNLQMTFDASVIPPPETTGAHVLQTSLTFIEPGYSPIVAPFEVARFISGIFPCLDRIWTLCDDGYEDEEARTLHGQWKEVDSHIPTIMEIREEGIMWAQLASFRPSTPTQ